MSDFQGIMVIGKGASSSTPDLVTIELGVSVRADTVAGAVSANRDIASAVIDALTTATVEHSDLTTSGYSIHPEYDHRDGEQRLLGYRATNNLNVRLRDLDRAGATIDTAVAASGDSATLNRLVFGMSDETSARDEAREEAWGDALARGEHLASLAGRDLGDVISIVETPGGHQGPPLMRMARAESTPIEPGSAITTVELEVRFSLV